jgi:serine/threonine protein kinase
MMRDLNNVTLQSRYRFETLIGEGTFARVYRVHDLRRGVDLAAKVLRPDIAQEPAFLERFRREAQVLAKLQHPHIVRYYDTIETEGVVFMLLDFIPGYTLQTYLYRLRQAMKISEVLHIMKPLSTALSYAHGEHIIHRDVKPGNILLHDNGQVYITDFGIARLLNEASSLTQDTSIGTPLYMAPEQILSKEVTLAADIYAMGILLYQMFTNTLPFTGKDPAAKGNTTADRVAYEHLNLPPPPPLEQNPQLSIAVQNVILQCLRKEPTARFNSAAAVYEALAEAVGATPAEIEAVALEGKPSPPSATLPEWSRIVQKVAAKTDPSNEQAPVETLASDSPHTTIHSDTVRAEDAARPTLVHGPPVEDKRQTQPHPVVSQPQPAYQPPQQPTYNPYPVQSTYSPPPTMRRPESSSSQSAIIGGIILGAIAALLVACIVLALFGLGVFDNRDDPPSPQPTPIIQVTPSQLIAQNLSTQTLSGTPFTLPTPPAATQIASNNWLPASTSGEFVYAAEFEGSLDIFSANINGDTPIRLTTSSLNETGPAYSPDGSQIAYYAYRGEGSADIWVMNADGSNARNLTNSNANERVVCWSPDGKKLAYHSNAGGDYDIYIYDLETGQSQQLTTSPYDDLGPSWSPDGSRIAFHSNEKNDFNEIFIINTDGTGRQQVSDGQWSAAFPDWKPNGSTLVFHAIVGNVYEIFTIQPDGSGLQDIFAAPNNERHPDWSPDGRALLYMVGAINAPSIYLTDLLSGETRPIVSGGQFPDWKPG